MSNKYGKFETQKLTVCKQTCLKGSTAIHGELNIADADVVYKTLRQINGLGSILNVPSTDYPTIQSAINAAGPGTIVRVASGDYYENIRMNNQGTTFLQVRDRDQNDLLIENINRGILLQGDTRWTLPHYVNGGLNPTNSASDARVTITTSVPGVGPFSGQAAGTFGTRVPIGPLQIQNTTGTNGNLAGPGQADVTNAFAGRIALTQRGSFGFATKAFNVQFPTAPGSSGAGAMILYNNQPGTISMGGVNPAITIPCYSITQADGLTLLAAMGANPTMTVTVSFTGGAYRPSTGSNRMPVVLSQPTPSSVTVTITAPANGVVPTPGAAFRDSVLPTSVNASVDQPNFNSVDLGIVPGDKILLAQTTHTSTTTPLQQIATIASVSGNTITLTASTLVNLTLPGSFIKFLPRVRIMPVTGQEYIFTMLNSSISMSGLWFDTNTSLGFASTQVGMYMDGSSCFGHNLTFYDSNDFSANGSALALYNSIFNVVDPYRDTSTGSSLAIAQWSNGITVDRSYLNSPNLLIANSTNGISLNLTNGSNVAVGMVTIVGNPGLAQSGSGGLSIDRGSVMDCLCLSISKIYGFGVDVDGLAQLIIEDSFDISDITAASSGSRGLSGLHVASGGSVIAASYPKRRDGFITQRLRDTNLIQRCTNVTVPVISGSTLTLGLGVSVGGKFTSGREVLFGTGGANDINMLKSGDGVSSMALQPGALANVLSVTASGAMDSFYELQTLEGALRAITLNPGQQSTPENVFGVYYNPEFPARTFTLMSKFAAAHTLTLSGGAYFVGAGGANGTTNNVATFAASIGAFIRFQVVSATSVLVLDQSGITFSP
jgi:hypothetical protein